ncbi:MAG: radical SAM protein [Gammaproteobacteria bacterium]|nr:radical SAM protein [Gammaproteobacteria bacterium]
MDRITDHLGRRFTSLRVSLTAACNYACTYCVPNGKRLQAASNELGVDDLLKAVGWLIETAGIEKLRITGGEPLVSSQFDGFLGGLQSLPLKEVSITTNGQLLKDKAPLIIDSGIRRVNISLDTLNALKFRQIARGGDLEMVIAGIDAMLAAGLKVKVNMVPLARSNGDEILSLLDFCLDRRIELRYIELMRMGHLLGSQDFDRDFIPMDQILEQIGQKYSYERTTAPYNATAVRFKIHNRGVFGIIPNESEPFCQSCTRLRLSSNGHLYGCLSNSRSYDIRELLQGPKEEGLPELHGLLVKALADKKLAFQGETTVMKFIGG